MEADGLEPDKYEKIEFREVMTVKKKRADNDGDAGPGSGLEDGRSDAVRTEPGTSHP
jgi:hypothetical protein